MEKSINLKILEVKQEIMDSVSKSKLPAVIVEMIMSEVSIEVQRQTQQIVDKEQKDLKESQAAESKEK